MHDLAYGYPCPFQSTLSMRRATKREGAAVVHRHISIHALHEESDPRIPIFFSLTIKFQSTLSMRRATIIKLGVSHTRLISIHALHEESDKM